MSEEFNQLMANLKDFLLCADLEYRERDAISSIEYQISEYVNGLGEEVERLREAQRWIPVEERLPEDVCGGASTYVEVIYANVDDETGEIGSQYYRKTTQYWHKYGLWEYEYNSGPRSFEVYGYRVIFWKNRTPLPEPPEVE